MAKRWVGCCWWIGFAMAVSAACGSRQKDLMVDDPRAVPGSGIEDSALGTRGSRADARAGRQSSSGPLQDILFSYDSFDLDEPARSVLRRNGEWLVANPDARIEIEGHCDERGTIEYNLALGARRAASAKNYLVALGIDPGRITTISYGEELPLCRDASLECQRRNRRGHFVILAP